MKRPLRFLQTILAAALLLGLGLVAPWLEREPASRLSIESRHDARCVPTHDHSICIQLQHARPLPQTSAVALPFSATNLELKPTLVAVAIAAVPAGHSLPRAPPQI